MPAPFRAGPALAWAVLDELGDPQLVIYRHHPECRGFIERYFDTAHGNIGIILHVMGQHGAVVHLVHVITRKNQHILWLVAANDVEVLKYSVCRSFIPGSLDPLLRR